MVDIFKFPKAKGRSVGGWLHQEDDDTLSFGISESDIDFPKVSFSTQVMNYVKRSADWNNQELADLFRVKRLLDNAGIVCEMERGLADEGDPWIVFCKQDGSVFIHMCRLDGMYLLDSPNLTAPIYGSNFSELVDSFSNRTVLSASGDKETGKRVVKLERGGKIFLHPSSLLAALIWTIFVASEDLVALSLKEDKGAADLGNDAEDLGGVATALSSMTRGIPLGTLDKYAEHLASSTAIKAEALAKDYYPQTSMNLKQISYTSGLSAIVIALGFFSADVTKESRNEFLDKFFALLEGVSYGGSEDKKAIASLDDDMPQDLDLMAILDVLYQAIEDQQANRPASAEMLEGNLDTLAVAQVIEDGPQSGAEKAELSLNDHDDPVEDLQGEEDTLSAQTISNEEPIIAELAENEAPLNFTDFKLYLPEELQYFDFGETYAEATFDITADGFEDIDLAGVVLGGLEERIVAVAPVVAEENDFQMFGDNVRTFIDFLFTKSTKVEMIALQREIIFLDSAAMSSGGNETYARSWDLEDGGTISMVGLRVDFAQFDLVA